MSENKHDLIAAGYPPEYDDLIKPVKCARHCFGGRIGMDNCNICETTGSQFLVSDGTRFPNTYEGFMAAAEHIRENGLDG
ncbi:MAG: hypothetical protein JKY32_07845 [Rhizobiales bacterium]|nr:hypothetical protein [Hyphomicrobiales bacterium]